jgi:hypothetical protein
MLSEMLKSWKTNVDSLSNLMRPNSQLGGSFETKKAALAASFILFGYPFLFGDVMDNWILFRFLVCPESPKIRDSMLLSKFKSNFLSTLELLSLDNFNNSILGYFFLKNQSFPFDS